MKLFRFVFVAGFLLTSCAVENTPTPPLSTPTPTLSQNGAVIATGQAQQTMQAATAAAASPTVVPTPMGGRNGLLLSFNGSTLWEMTNGTGDWREDLDLIYTYDMTSRKMKLFLEGYSCIGASPDGRKIALRKTEDGKTDLFVMDLEKPEEIVLLYEDVVNTNVLSDYSYWFPGSEWIGFIAFKDGIRQIFVIHPDGTNLTQVTHSPIGAVEMQPVFHDGIYWGEGKEYKSGYQEIKNYKWTKLDGTEVIGDFHTVSSDGKYITRSSKPQNPDCLFCDYVIGDPATGEIKEVSLVKPAPDNEYPEIQPLSDDKWLVQWRNKNQENLPESPTLAEYKATIEYWIYSPDGKPLFSFADLPHNHSPLPDSDVDSVDSYDLIFKNSSNMPVMALSPDGNLLLLKHEIVTYLEKGFVDKDDISYYFLNISTFEIQGVPNLMFDRNTILGPNQGFFWIELP